jgi:hypothetical protein
MGFYGYLSPYSQMIEKIQGGKLARRDETHLVRDFVKNNRGFALACLLNIHHSAVAPLKKKYLRSLALTGVLMVLGFAAALPVIVLVAQADPVRLSQGQQLLLVILLPIAILLIALGLVMAYQSRHVLDANMHNLIKNYFKPIDRRLAYQQSRSHGLEKYSERIIKTIFCEKWPERALILKQGQGFEIVFEELYYYDENNEKYLENGTLDYQWLEVQEPRKSADTLEMAEKIASDEFSPIAGKDAEIFSWLD